MNGLTPFVFGLALAASFTGVAARAVAAGDEPHVVSRARLHVSDLVAKVPEDLGSVDLGPAPPPGATRLVARAEIEEHVRAAGLDPKRLKLPTSIRVVGASMHFSPEQLAKAATPAIEKALPAGVTLTRVEPSNDLVTHPGTTVRAATIPKLPHQRGPSQTSAMIELVSEDGVVIKLPVPISVEIGEAAAHADVPRGFRLELVYERGAIKIATTGVALSDADVGDTTQMSLIATGRVVRAKVLTRDRAEIVEQR
jgi:Chaperone for flagella basal body P-ring formation